MDYWWFVIFIAAFIVALAGYFMWRQFFMTPQDASEVGAAGTAPDYNDRRTRVDRRESSTSTRNVETYDADASNTDEPGAPHS